MVDCTKITWLWEVTLALWAHLSRGTQSLGVFFFFFNESISSVQSPRAPSACTCSGCKQDPGAEAAVQGKQGQAGSLQPCLASRLAAGSWGNPPGLLNKGQSWILTTASVSLVLAWQPFCPEPLLGGQACWAQSPARATPATYAGLQGSYNSKDQRTLRKMCAQNLRDAQIMIDW